MKITRGHVESAIHSEHYFGAGEALRAIDEGEFLTWVDEAPSRLALDMLTICVLVLKNGFTVTGESVCLQPEYFDADVEREAARQDAVQKCWPILSHALMLGAER